MELQTTPAHPLVCLLVPCQETVPRTNPQQSRRMISVPRVVAAVGEDCQNRSELQGQERRRQQVD